MSDNIYDILGRLQILNEGQDAAQKSVHQLPALFKPKNISPVLGSKKDPANPMKGYFVGGESEEKKDESIEEGDVVPFNRGGYNKLRDKEDYLDKRDDLYKLLSMSGLDQSMRDHTKQRLDDLDKAAKLAGIIKEAGEDINPVTRAVANRIATQHPDLLSRYGVEAVIHAIDNVADFVGDVEEIGTSDTSAWVNMVKRDLESSAMSEQDISNVLEVEEATGRRDAYQRDYDSSITGFGRPHDHRGLEQELAHERNNYAVNINGRTWKVVADKQQADNIARSLRNKGKDASVSVTGADPSESIAEAGADAFMPGIENTPEYKKGYSTGKLPVPYPEGTQQYVNYYKGVIDKVGPKVAEGSMGEELEPTGDGAFTTWSGGMRVSGPNAYEKARQLDPDSVGVAEGLNEAHATEDVLSTMKKKLGDYLQDVATAIKKDPDLKDRIPQDVDKIGPAVKTITTDDGHELKIHGNEDDGFRITIKNKPSKAKFENLEHAIMACEMYCSRRRMVEGNADYVEEKR